MKFYCILFNRAKFLNLIYLLIFITLLLMWVVHIIDYPSSLFLLIALCSFLLVLVLKFIVEKKLQKKICFYIEGDSFLVNDESEIYDDGTSNHYLYTGLNGYKISLVGDSKYYHLKLYFINGHIKKFTFIKKDECSKALESLNLKIIDFNKSDSNIEKIKLIPDFYTTEKGLWLIRICVAILFFAIIRLFIYQSKSSLMSILILFSGVVQTYGTRRTQIQLNQKLMNGEPLT